MNIVLFTHPSFLGQQSMPRFTNMLADNFRSKGYNVKIYSPEAYFFKLPVTASLKKWLGYIDQFLIFPIIIKKRIKSNTNTIYVFTDHALGIWVPIAKKFPTLVICHDFLAQRSAQGEIPQNPTGMSGRVYQKLIRKGYSVADNFISVSNKTQQDLHDFLGRIPPVSRIVYNGLNKKFKLIKQEKARQILTDHTGIDLSSGYILHVGGNQWYKNRVGVVKIYSAWREIYNNTLPLLLIGEVPSPELKKEIEGSGYQEDIFTLSNISDEYINAAYSGALVLLFPSIAEGFGWPIAEAMGCGCPVITTGEAPMTEVGGDAAEYIPVMPINSNEVLQWANSSAAVLNDIVSADRERDIIIEKGLANVHRFETTNAINEIEKIIYEIYK